MMSRYLRAVMALLACFQLASSMRYQTTGTTRQTTYRYVYPANRVITGPNVCKSTCCPGWQLNAYTGRCTIPICQPPCQNGGRCLRPGSCVCSTGFSGTYCQYQAYGRIGSGSASGGTVHTSSSGSVRPGSGGYSRITSSTSTRPLTGTGTATFSIRPGSSTSSRTYISRVRPGTATTGSRTYAVTYTTGGRGNVVATNGQRIYPSSPVSSSSTSGSSTYSTSAVGQPSSHTLARFTMRGPCFRRVSSSHCMAPLSDVTTLHDDCCSTVGQGWGNGCYACPQVLGQELHCPRGFKKSPDTGKCIDVDECTAFDNICMHGTCLNAQGSYRCRCDEGYMSDTSGTQCVVSVKQMCYTRVINGQCYGGSGSRMPTTQMQCCCSLGAAWGSTCERCPQQGSAEFRAMCPQGTGYHYKPSNGYNHVSAIVSSGNPRPTQNVDPCVANARLCLSGQCIGTGNGAYRCECSRGFRLSSRGNQCIDVNECSESRGICNGGRCLNTYGSFHCICSQARGLVWRGGTCEDINECTSRNVNPCGEYVCQNTLGSYHCLRTECSDGYRYDLTHQRCVDVNECSDENVCEHGHCINIEGSYRCMCPQGFTSNPTETDCIDVDECGQTRDVPLCGGEAICVNEVGNYRCVCTGDALYNSESRTCQIPAVQSTPEIVEVERKDCYGSISDLNFCSNLLGSNITKQQCCCSVGAGWGDDCDLMVCPSQGTLAYNETCPGGHGNHVITQRKPVETLNLPTTYPEAAAHPSAGQEASIAGINECEIFPEICGTATCVDRDPTFECTCAEGYKFDDERKTCIVYDHCFVNPGVCGNGSCENTETSYNCKCPGNYQFDSSLRRCTFIDHCESPGICGNGTCTSTERGPVCSCPEGHHFIPSRRLCEVQDYCIVYSGICGNGTCVNRADGYDCRCPEGQRFNERSSTCEVTNFCVVLSGICGNGTCIPTENGYTCRCPSGFQFDSDAGYCKDIDLCVDHSDLCGNGTCVDQGQNFICICPEGFEFSNTKVCIDINECFTSSHSCGLEASCINTHGSHQCACPGGFEFNPASRTCDDINECRISPDVCGNATCTNTDGSFHCSCAFGYIYNQTLGMCIDTNECAVYRSICSNGTCMNTQGSYRCVCPRGYRYVSGNGNGCLDVNECTTVPGLCGDATCFNREGSFLCTCNPGFEFDEQERRCVDINECFRSEGICGNGQCENSEGSFRCICPQGANFDEARRQCIALESHTTSRDPETVEADTCSALCGNATCATDASGPVCTCRAGYEFDTSSKACSDVDECERNPEICGTAVCQNRIGGYTCICPEGYVYKRKKKTCADFNECKKYRTLCANGRCVNKKGTFACVCSPGHTFSYSSRRCVAATASSDVCSRNPGICGNATCSAPGHSIRCLCPAGYDYDPSVKGCKIISECDVPNRCGEGALCEDTVAGYRCVCTAGYVYNYQDRSCREIPQPPPEASGGQGYRPAVIETALPKRGPNECNSSPCINGVCIDRPDGFICQCVEGYQLVDSVTCEDINECESPDAHDMCMYGNCVNEPPGSYTCECTNGLILDSTGRRCIELIGPVSGGINGGIPQEEPLGPCWGQPGPNEDICSNVVSQESTYQQCCCNTGFSWGNECYSCPLRHSQEYRMLCVALSSFSNQDGRINQQVADQPAVPGIPRS